MRKWRPWRATKIEVLDFIRRKEIVTIYDLVGEYGYSYSGANKRLLSLEKLGLISKLGVERGKRVLTELGFKKLNYYGKI